MTPDEVRRRVDKLRADAPQQQHSPDHHMEEDDLYEEVLRAIASGAPDPATLAAEALKTKENEFPRWYE